MKRNRLHIHIKNIKNGFIMKDLTDQKDKDKEGNDPDTYVSHNKAQLKKQIEDLINNNLEGASPEEGNGTQIFNPDNPSPNNF